MSPLTREAGETLLRHFAPRMGDIYARERNYDQGPARHEFVSCLSPYVRRRLVLEQDLIEAALASHGPKRAEKFIQEVFWRAYFKGWLEQRPTVWRDYVQGLSADLAALDSDAPLADRVAAAESGQTGLECFDEWVHELVQTGYLHNHARMWFASIWIFTLSLPWRIGADFLYRHLLDGDPASNTLSWRWVAGLHTRGKAYAADASNIDRYSRGRFRPSPHQLAPVTAGLEHTEPQGLPERTALRMPRAPNPTLESAVLITEEDCRPEDFAAQCENVKGAATLSASGLRSPRVVSGKVMRAEDEALADAALRSGFNCAPLKAGDPAPFLGWIDRLAVKQLLTPFIPQGPLRDWLSANERALGERGITICEWQRPFDRLVWPHASAGFFKVKEKIPVLLRALRQT